LPRQKRKRIREPKRSKTTREKDLVNRHFIVYVTIEIKGTNVRRHLVVSVPSEATIGKTFHINHF